MSNKILSLDIAEKTCEYAAYVKVHIENVYIASQIFFHKCKGLKIVVDQELYKKLIFDLAEHDMSKLGKNEFSQYRQKFYPVDGELCDASIFDSAWEHHKENNMHHWESWTSKEYGDSDEWMIHCSHMVIDWMAMSMKFGGTAEEYYRKNKDNIKIPEYADSFLEQIFEFLRKPVDGETLYQ